MLKEGEAYAYDRTFALLYTYISTNDNFSDNHKQAQVRDGQPRLFSFSTISDMMEREERICY